MYIQWKKEWVIPVGVGIASFGAGVGVGVGISYILNRRERSTAKEQIQELEEHQVELDFERTERTREFNLMLQQLSHVADKVKHAMERDERFDNFVELAGEPEPEDVVEHHVNEEPWVFNGGYAGKKEPVPAVVTPKPERVTLFGNQSDSWNYEEEEAKRSPDAPYIIHYDEYINQEAEGYHQSTLTYYSGDEILVDEHDVPIYKIDKVVGKLEFGKGSNDPNVVYVRNDKIEVEYEILQDPGYYQVEVLGEEIENTLSSGDLKHSVQKFRSE